MTKWLVTYSRQAGARWKVVGFGGDAGAEARGVVNLVAVGKSQRRHRLGLKRGDLLEIVPRQTKGGVSSRPGAADVRRLSCVATHHRMHPVVLAVWERQRGLEMFRLGRTGWGPGEVFG